MTIFRPNLFYALWPDDAVREELARLQTRLHGCLTRPPNLHLTLAFLGPQPEALQPLLRSILARLHFGPLDLEINHLGHFAKNRIAWAGMLSVPTTLTQLQRTLASELDRKGITSDSARAFRPHITLARNADAPQDLPFAPIRWRAEQVVLAQSPSPGDKPLYRVLATQTSAFVLE
jgi:2'-5' RNA ligase